MEVFNELVESEVSIIGPYLSAMVSFCLEVGTEHAHAAAVVATALVLVTFVLNMLCACLCLVRWALTPH